MINLEPILARLFLCSLAQNKFVLKPIKNLKKKRKKKIIDDIFDIF